MDSIHQIHQHYVHRVCSKKKMTPNLSLSNPWTPIVRRRPISRTPETGKTSHVSSGEASRLYGSLIVLRAVAVIAVPASYTPSYAEWFTQRAKGTQSALTLHYDAVRSLASAASELEGLIEVLIKVTSAEKIVKLFKFSGSAKKLSHHRGRWKFVFIRQNGSAWTLHFSVRHCSAHRRTWSIWA